MRAVDIIIKKRSGKKLDKKELAFLIDGFVTDSIPEYQISSWLMAVFFRGMNSEEIADLTQLMIRSGKIIDLSAVTGPFVDKHSTGGVGDKISLILAPMVAACGVRVPMMSGRALGHTGGTLDKLASIPGYRTNLSEKEFTEFIRLDGFAMTGQTNQMVPADKKLYALRDVSGTVESIPLITASILSKKVAEGAEALVLDVKSGRGAFMKTEEEALALATSLVNTGIALGKKMVAVITNMSEPLGKKIGNFFEIEESIDCLEGKGPEDVMLLSYRLGAWMLLAGGIVQNIEEGETLCRRAITSGKALEKFYANVVRQGGDVKKVAELRGRYRSKYAQDIVAKESGWIESINSYNVGIAGIYLGVGRNKTEDTTLADVGFILDKVRGDTVQKGEKIGTMFGKDAESLLMSIDLINDSFTYSHKAPPPSHSLIIREISAL